MAPKMFNAAVLCACLGFQFAGADFRAVCDTIVTARLDPIVFPGAMSKHLHEVVGSLAFGPTEARSTMRNSKSSCSPIGDFSSYWAPAVFFNDTATGTYTQMPGGLHAYYTTGRSQPVANAVAIATNFPKNLSMITTNSLKSCMYLGVEVPFSDMPPDDSGCDKMVINYYFPNCWNGGKYKSDQSHVSVAWQRQTVALGTCDADHPHALFTVRLEHTIPIPPEYSTWTGKCPYTLSSGAGFSTAHADATLVWDTTTLLRLVNNCATLSGSDCDFNYMRLAGFADAYRVTDTRAAIAAPFAATIADVYKTLPAPGAYPPF